MLGKNVVIPKEARSILTLPEAEWLLSCAAADDTIAETPGDTNVRPYMANYAAMGLTRAYEVTGNPRYIVPVWKWLAWYRDHMDPTTGYVNDYAGPEHARVDSGVADSTDAYAGTYLVTLYLAYFADPQGESRIDPFLDSIELALTAIESTQQSDGLTFALPTFDVKYLEDNIETLVGARSAELFGQITSVATAKPGLYARAHDVAEKLATGIGYMWNNDAISWDYAIHSNRVFAHNDWSDENSQRQQIWATGWGAYASDTIGRAIMAAYGVSVPGWTKKTDSYEVMPLWGFRKLQMHDQANGGTREIRQLAKEQNHAYPWTCQISGIILLGGIGFSPAMPDPKVNFPDGSNLITDPKFLVDANSNGRADAFVGSYGDPTSTLHPLIGGGNYQKLDVPDGNGWALNWAEIPVTPNTYVTFSFWVRITRLGSGGAMNIKYELYDSSHSLVTYGYAPKSSVTGFDFVRIYVNAWIPAGVTTFRPIVELNSGTIDIAYPQLEVSGSPTAPPYGIPVDADVNSASAIDNGDGTFIGSAMIDNGDGTMTISGIDNGDGTYTIQ
jgi:hypothetical protein